MVRRVAAVFILCVLAGPAQARAQALDCTPRTEPIKRGLTLEKTEHPDARTTVYFFRSEAVGRTVRARVVLPKQYTAEPSKRFPVVVHLHGTNNTATTWNLADVEQHVLGDTPAILVMPDGGTYDFYTDHFGTALGKTGPPPAWDTFHNLELVPWIDANLRTTGRHAIAGSSMGGFGAMAYPMRHPGLYDAAASLSGAVDIELPVAQPVLYGVYGQCIFGNPILQADNWRANNPTAHVDRLKGVSLFVSAGNGLPGRYDDAGSPPTAAALEILIRMMTDNFLAALAKDAIPVTTYLYGNGEHPDGVALSRFYDFDGMQRFLPQALAAMDAKTPATAAKPCASRRVITATVRVPRRSGAIRSATATLAGKRVATRLRGRTVTTTAQLTGLPRGAVKLVITVRLRGGRTLRSVRTYHPCS